MTTAIAFYLLFVTLCHAFLLPASIENDEPGEFLFRVIFGGLSLVSSLYLLGVFE